VLLLHSARRPQVQASGAAPAKGWHRKQRGRILSMHSEEGQRFCCNPLHYSWWPISRIQTLHQQRDGTSCRPIITLTVTCTKTGEPGPSSCTSSTDSNDRNSDVLLKSAPLLNRDCVHVGGGDSAAVSDEWCKGVHAAWHARRQRGP
jgi:hypothetical protein